MSRIVPPLSRAELLEAAAIIEGRLLDGTPADDIMEALGYTPEQFVEARKFLLDQKSEEVRGKSREHSYVEYTLEHRRTIQELDKLVKDLDKNSQYNAIIGALRLRSDLVDKIMDRGQDFGFIKKTPQTRDIIAGIVVTDMSTADLKKALLENGQSFNKMMEKFGEKPFMDLEDKPLHYGSPIFKKPTDIEVEGEETDDEHLLMAPKKASKTAKANTKKRNAGRGARVRDR